MYDSDEKTRASLDKHRRGKVLPWQRGCFPSTPWDCHSSSLPLGSTRTWDTETFWSLPSSPLSINRLLLLSLSLPSSLSSLSSSSLSSDEIGNHKYLSWRRFLLVEKASTNVSFPGRRGRYKHTRELLLDKRVKKLVNQKKRSVFDTDSLAKLPNIGKDMVWIENEKKVSQSEQSARERYNFSGIHHMFVHHKRSVSVLKYANDDQSRVAMGCVDGELSVCHTFANPHVVSVLRGHEGAITDLAWSPANDFLVTTAEDKSIRQWDMGKYLCIRVLLDHHVSLSCAFHPFNSNVFVCGKENGDLSVYNMSTGKILDNVKLEKGIRCLMFTHGGRYLYAASVEGNLFALSVDKTCTRLLCMQQWTLGNAPVDSLDYCTHGNISNQYRGPVLLVYMRDGVCRLLCVKTNKESVHMVKLAEASGFSGISKSPVSASFCPLVRSETSPTCFCCGSMDGTVSIYESGANSSELVSRLQGHGSAVRSVSWNFDESLLGTADDDGLVIIWKRAALSAVLPIDLDMREREREKEGEGEKEKGKELMKNRETGSFE
mmetsp:Transcript_33908/g.95408  ORF Transcript_33908/g.95408 Transcript_33908/m.95408 type:complete len:546 (+) Transcript_33908:232-1869(+)